MAERTRRDGAAPTDPCDLSASDALSIALVGLVEHPHLSELTVATVEGLWRGFVSRVERLGYSSLGDVGSNEVLEFVKARNRDGSSPSVATMHLRRWAVRFLFQLLRQSGLQVDDPTVDLKLPPKRVAGVRPLTDEEVALCRLLAVYPPDATLKPAAWGLAESTATTSEIPAVRRSDVETEHGLVRVSGSRLVIARCVPLTEFAREQIERRFREIDEDPDALVAYIGNGSRPQAAAAMVIGKVLRRAGLAGETGIRPASIRAWAGLRAFDETGSVEEVARRLGMRSLDATARLIGLDWRED